jgi:hypothetical protein
MSKERVLTPATPTMSADTRRINSAGEKTGPAEQTSKTKVSGIDIRRGTAHYFLDKLKT